MTTKPKRVSRTKRDKENALSDLMKLDRTLASCTPEPAPTIVRLPKGAEILAAVRGGKLPPEANDIARAVLCACDNMLLQDRDESWFAFKELGASGVISKLNSCFCLTASNSSFRGVTHPETLVEDVAKFLRAARNRDNTWFSLVQVCGTHRINAYFWSAAVMDDVLDTLEGSLATQRVAHFINDARQSYAKELGKKNL